MEEQLPGNLKGQYKILNTFENDSKINFTVWDEKRATKLKIEIFTIQELDQKKLNKIRQKLEHQVSIVRRLEHPNIERVYGYGEYENGRVYLLTDYYEGETLEHLIEKGPIPWQDAFHMLIPIASALGYAHANGIIHRDIKPSNILITEARNLLLLDFGIRNTIYSAENINEKREIIGTPAYMPPEVYMNSMFSVRSDIYSIGAILYEMITGQRLYQSSNISEMIYEKFYGVLINPKQLVPSIPDSVESVILHALAANPEKRYGSIQEFAAALNRCLQNEPTEGSQTVARLAGDSTVDAPPPEEKDKKKKQKGK